MSAAAVTADGPGRYRVSGPMVFATAPGLLEQSRRAFGRDSAGLEIDLSGVTDADSAGLALLLEWLSWAGQGESVRFSGMPAKLAAIAELSELDALFAAPGQPS
ncbi:MAG: STAS domain-containing protein [Chromatiales bacterium]|nr:STAS domain-containing protein [Chromatiales bacterium]